MRRNTRGFYLWVAALVLTISGALMITMVQVGILGWLLQGVGIIFLAFAIGARSGRQTHS
ncbi:hypothetical protein [Glutamicibacter arilaitensis]|uniref:hypothetical protein n=1 Tax=Glutamicibacter arilaitensis TaxID=256701 RepID=UPI003A9225A6